METDSACDGSIPDKFYMSDHLQALYMNQSQCAYDALKHASLDEIGLRLNESLHIGDVPKMSPDTILRQPFDNSSNLDVRNDADCKDIVEIDTTRVTAQELSKSLRFPCAGKTLVAAVSTDEKGEQDVNGTATVMKPTSCESSEAAHTRFISLPIPLKLVSAMKGTREKLGAPREKLTVTWAPDVYDPPPSAPSTAVINHKPRQKSDRKKSVDNNNKKGKNKRKKKSSKGSSSKDKKPIQKYYRGTNAFYQPFEGEGKMVVEGFDCGSTFLKTSVTNLHFSLAEAT